MSHPLTILAVGERSSRKTELLIEYTGCQESYKTYFGVVEKIIVDSRPYSVHFVDAPTKNCEQLRRSLIENADCVLLCYSISDRESFRRLSSKWCIEVRKSASRVPIVLVGIDGEDGDEGNRVSWDEGCNLKHLIGAKAFVQCSLTTLQGIDEVFIAAVRSTYPEF